MGDTSTETKHMRNPKEPLPFGVFALFTPDEAMEKDKPPRLKRRGLTIVIGALIMFVCWALSRSPDFVENVYARGFSQSVTRMLASITGLIGTSFAEIFIVGSFLYLLIPFTIAAIHVARRKRRMLNAIAAGFFRFWAFAAIVLALFYLSWGINYSRAPLPERVSWKPLATPADEGEFKAQTEEIAALCEQLIAASNANYMQATGSEDFDRVSFPPASSQNLDATLDKGFERVQKKLALEDEFAISRGKAKPVALSLLMNYLGISGFYFPWTGEANYNRLIPAPMVPHTVAHEKAHQRGITSEDEANFIGFLVCAMSDDPYTRYSGYLFAQRQLLGELAGRDAARAKELLKTRFKGVQRDVDAMKAHWKQYEGPAEKVSSTMNDTYLKTQGVKEGVASYSASKSLIILFARNNGGKAVLDLPPN